jgi:hypothetical protein
MPISAYLYPWDVDGDPAAADRIAGLGVTEVSLAVAYHAVRAVTPFHPGHRVVTCDAAVYHRPDPERWRGARLRPAAPGPDQAGSFERAADALHRAGLKVNAWLVLAHNGRLGAKHPECVVRNAYGDPYPWALCIGSPLVGEYAAALSAEVAALGCVDGIELEACGWYGYDHGSAHDKTGGGAPGGVPGWLLDLCFCPACADGFRAAGADPAQLARTVRAALDAGYRQEIIMPNERPVGVAAPAPASTVPASTAPASTAPANTAYASTAYARTAQAGTGPDTGPGNAVQDDTAELLGKVRFASAEGFLYQVLAAVRDAAPGQDVLVHSHPDPRQAGSNPGFDPAVLLGHAGADGVILECPGPAAQSAALVARTAQAAQAAQTAGLGGAAGTTGADVRAGTGRGAAPLAGRGPCRVAATLTAVTALGAHLADLPGHAEAVLAAGATDLRLYHAGLASPADHAAMRSIASAFPA